MMMIYDNSMRTIIDVPDDLVRRLDEVGLRENCSRAALIRQAIAEYLQHKIMPPGEAAFGIWKGMDRDGVQYQATLRSEWEGE